MTINTTYAVSGMTCGHCVNAVTEELGALPGVRTVAVDLVPGAPSAVRVVSDSELDLTQVRDAVEEAGYVLAEGTS